MECKGRVSVRQTISLEPYTTLLKGETGTLVYYEEDAAGIYRADILMDKTHAGLAAWSNEAHLVGPELSLVTIDRELSTG